MAKARALDKRRASIRNIKKITRTMELIATARFKKAMDRATAATAYTRRITQLVADLATTGLEVSHPLLAERAAKDNATLLVLTANRGLCGGYNGGVIRAAVPRYRELKQEFVNLRMEVSGKRGISAFKFRRMQIDQAYLEFEDQPKYDAVQAIANRYLDEYVTGKLDRLEVVYTRFISISRQTPVIETLLPLGSIGGEEKPAKEPKPGQDRGGEKRGESMYEFLPSAASILEEVVPMSFRVKLFKCFLDAAVSEQIARMVAMKSATENANEMIRNLSQSYNRARQSQITGEIMEVIGGVEALQG
jgi:F-type H+-transporting ATPase subunit gamma